MPEYTQLSIFDQLNQTPFDAIRHYDEQGNECWYARELMPLLEYTEWRNFKQAIRRAKTSLKKTESGTGRHFVESNKIIDLGSGIRREIDDFKLSRRACYLIAMNGDPSKEAIAQAQAYFLEQARKQEIAEGKARFNPRSKELALLEGSGFGDHPLTKNLRTRISGIDTFNQLRNVIAAKCDNPHYADIINAEYIGLFNATADALKRILHTKSIRDALPTMQLKALEFAESALEEVLNRADRLTSQEICRIATMICLPLGKQLREISDALGVSPITGKSLLDSGFEPPSQLSLGDGL